MRHRTGRMISTGAGVSLALTWLVSGGVPTEPRRLDAAGQAAPSTTSSTGTQGRPPLFRGGANFVYVDVYPRRDGRVIAGLKAEDFQILEDGKPQQVELFEYIESPPNTPDQVRVDPNTQAEGERIAADPRTRVFVVYLDIYHVSIAGSSGAQQPVREFLDRTIGTADVFGTLTPEVPVGNLVFGRRPETLERELRDFWTWGQLDRNAVMARTEIERRLVQCRPGIDDLLVRRHREDQLMTSLENLMVRLRDLKDERKNVLFLSEGWTPAPPTPSLASAGSGDLPGIGVTPTGRLTTGAYQPMMRDNAWCDAQLGRLAYLDNDRRFRDLLRRANEANVSFFPIDVGGLKTGGGPGNTSTLRTLAENTDGLAAVNTNDLSSAVRRVGDQLAAYYLLGYYSTNPAADGRFRRIDVKVAQPRVSVAARPGYFADTAAAVALARDGGAATEATPVDVELASLARIRPDAELYTRAVAVPGGVDVIAELGGREGESGRWRTGGDVRVTLAGDGAAEVSASARLEPGSRALRVHVPLAGSVPAGLRVTTRVVGAGEQIEAQTDVAAAGTARLGPAQAFRAAPSLRASLKPLADFQLRRTERLHVEWAVLAPVSDPEARVLDRKGQPLAPAVASAMAGVDARSVLAVDLPLSALAEGDYVLELTVGPEAERERKLLAFRVVR